MCVQVPPLSARHCTSLLNVMFPHYATPSPTFGLDPDQAVASLAAQ